MGGFSHWAHVLRGHCGSPVDSFLSDFLAMRWTGMCYLLIQRSPETMGPVNQPCTEISKIVTSSETFLLISWLSQVFITVMESWLIHHSCCYCCDFVAALVRLTESICTLPSDSLRLTSLPCLFMFSVVSLPPHFILFLFYEGIL